MVFGKGSCNSIFDQLQGNSIGVGEIGCLDPFPYDKGRGIEPNALILQLLIKGVDAFYFKTYMGDSMIANRLIFGIGEAGGRVILKEFDSCSPPAEHGVRNVHIIQTDYFLQLLTLSMIDAPVEPHTKQIPVKANGSIEIFDAEGGVVDLLNHLIPKE